MELPIFYFIPLMLCYHVMSQEGSPPVPTPTPSSSPRTNSECPFIDFTCEPGLPTTSDTFSQSDVCEPIFNPAVAEAGTLIFSGGRAVGFKCHNVYGLQTALLCFPHNIPTTDDYCFCDNSAFPRFRISEVPDIKFIGNSSRVSEDEGTVTVCAVSGKLAEEFTPFTVTISTVPNTVKDGIDFVSLNKEISFSASDQTHCVDVTVLKDSVDEVDETLLLALTLKYAPFDVPLDTYTVTIIDSDIVGVGLEQEVLAEVVHERTGNVSICVVTNVTLSGARTASAVLRTEDVTAQAGIDYLAAHEPIVFRVNGGNRTCVNITIHDDRVMDEAYEVFLVQLTSTDTPVFADQTVVVILDHDDQLYPYGSEAGDAKLPPGIVSSKRTSSPPLTLAPSFRFFSRDETTLHVNTNGVLSFNRPFHEQRPQPFPYNSLTMISPYWDHFSTARFGSIYYRSTTDPALLSRARYHLRDIFYSARSFSPSYLFIATWDNVPQFGILSDGDPGLANLFQVVMATDGMKSFVIFIYADIKWGEGGMGFNAGDGVKSFTLPGSLTATARDIEYGSNVDIASLYAYRVDLPNISSPGDCEGDGEADSEPVCTQREVVQIGFERNSYTVEEGDKSVTVCAEVIAGTATVPVSVTLVTVDIESAQDGKDYTKERIELTFDKSIPRVCTEIAIVHDSLEEEKESFLVILTTTQTYTVSLKPRLAFVTIHDGAGDYAGVRIAILLTVVCSVITYACFKGQKNRSKPLHHIKPEEERKDSSQLHSQQRHLRPPQPLPPDQGGTEM